MSIQSVNPASGEVLRTFQADGPAEIERKLALAAAAFHEWRRVPFAERARLMLGAAEILERGKDRLGRIMTAEMGKPIQSARDEAAKCASACRTYAASAERLLADESVETGASLSYVRYQPLGPILAVMPWNFPFWQVFRFAAPALMAGNTGLLKHASNVPQCALATADVFREAGFPEGAFQTLLIGSAEVARLIADDRVKAVTLTGSEPAGREVAAQAGRHIKKTVLELGGSDPFLVMASADLQAAVRTAVRARVVNNGQSCIAAKRFLIAETVANEFERGFVPAMEALRVGDPMDESTELGPLATPQILEALDDQVRRSAEAGGLSAPATITPRPCWRTFPQPRPPLAKSCSARWRASSASATSMPPSASRTPPRSDWERASGQMTRPSAPASSTRSTPAWSSSTAWSPPTHAFPSAA